MPSRHRVSAMKQLNILIILVFASLHASAEVFSCTGPDGERYFSDTPCEAASGKSVMEQRIEKELKRARSARIEELEVSITKTKRELLDTEAAYKSSLTGRTPEERAILKENYEEKSQGLKAQLSELESRRSELVEQSFAEHARGSR